MARTIIYPVQAPGIKNPVKEMEFDSAKVKLEAYGVVLRDVPGSGQDSIWPWHRVASVVQKP